MLAISNICGDRDDLIIQCSNGHNVRIKKAAISCRFDRELASRTQEACYDRFSGEIVFSGYAHLLTCLLTWSIKGALKPEQLAHAA